MMFAFNRLHVRRTRRPVHEFVLRNNRIAYTRARDRTVSASSDGVRCWLIMEDVQANIRKREAIRQLGVGMAHALKLTIVAEGVESQEQAKILRLLRCDQMQGYLISKPLPFDEMTI